MSDAPATPQKLTLTSGAGGPVLIATGLFALFLIVYFVAPALSRVKNRPPGDGSDPATYGFVLDGRCSGRGVSGGGPVAPRLGAIFGRPEKMEGTAVVAFNREEYGKYLVPSEIVVAYADGDDAVAWPLLAASHPRSVQRHGGGRAGAHRACASLRAVGGVRPTR